ncbi:divinyl chlorophyllide a 8-vinyl-reductase, chloroplastic [Physcomitrium patens]|uniref:Divinyl chlorophyllide a 8-vinyl-reductase, chloroplastic n=1 Tax=Physcomitrium patens TaxID=3218 RepID=A9SY59_PHYPA|nr:divinyl chlorophyllide a 8-vinyl-reductase, chloroplastic-like [Physcomitrium patens]PNR50678.1 hypothetical protein PHYPA_009864 [Physcomitrium patens]|eukprot:XP_024380255.1 divinyl chlorophyllide a 8-vinyl-reductase, chloroplastic-like [Physcomitrella patens]
MSLSLVSARATSSLLPGAVSSAPCSHGFSQVSSIGFLSLQHSHISFRESSGLLGFQLPSLKISRELETPLVRQICRAALAPEVEAAVSKQSWRSKEPKDTTVMIVGATGYIGKFVVREMVNRGYNVIAVAREKSGIGGKVDAEQTIRDFPGSTVVFADVSDTDSITSALQSPNINVDVVISCLASRTGGKKDSWKIDYQATRNSLDAGVARGASHFVLLSAICVQKPLLEFQKAKLKFEDELVNYGNGLTYSIVRPTAFFKSLGGQVQSVQGGGPYVMFGDGKLCACKPISEADLASFISDCVSDVEKVNQMLPIGGPGKALTPLEQGEMLFKIVGKEPKFIKVPIGIMDFVIGVLDNLSKVFPNLEDAAEFGKIGRYYAAESMLVLDPVTQKYDADATPGYGSDTLEAFFDRCVREGMAGQELGDQAVFKS